MEAQFQPVKKEDSGLSVKDAFFKYIRFFPLFIVSVILALLIAYTYLRYSIPSYQSTGSIVINGDNKAVNSGGTNDKFQQLFGGGAKDIANEIELLRSRPLMEKVVDELDLNFSYYLKGKFKDENRYASSGFTLEPLKLSDSSASFTFKINFLPNGGFKINDENKVYSIGQTFVNSSGVFRITGNGDVLKETEYKVIWRPAKAVASELVSNLLVAPKGATGILILTLEAPNPRLAADVINNLMKQYQITTIEDKNETTRKIIAFIDDRLKIVSKELDSVTASLLRYQLANNLMYPEAQSTTYFTKAETTDNQIIDQQTQLSVLQLIENYLSDKRHALDLVPSTLGIADPTLTNLISAYNVAQLEYKSLIDANIPATNPRVQQKMDQVERLRQNVFENIRNLKTSYQASLNRLKEKSSSVQAQIRLLPLKEQNLQEIKKEQLSKQALYNLLNEKREESAISLAGTISNTKVLDIAAPNNTPVKPNRKNIQLIALVAGLALPALILFIIEMFNDKIGSRADIEKATDAPIVGEIGHSNHKHVLVVQSSNRSVIAEQFRIIRSNLQYILAGQPKSTVLVTSSSSGEGKSFISTNLGAVMALANKKTIILEFDIRKPKILAHLGIGRKPGLTNYLLGKVTAEELPVPVPDFENLYVLACGPVPPNPAELLLEPKLNDLFAYLKEHFDFIIIDTAPIGMVSDAMSLSRFVDSTLYIVRQDFTYKKQLGLIDGFHTDGRLPKVSLVLNDVRVLPGYGYKGYGKYGYGYGYGYGSGYFEDEKPNYTFLERWFGIKSRRKKLKV